MSKENISTNKRVALVAGGAVIVSLLGFATFTGVKNIDSENPDKITRDMHYDRPKGIALGVEEVLEQSNLQGMWSIVAGVDDKSAKFIPKMTGTLYDELLNKLPETADSVGYVVAAGEGLEVPSEFLFVVFDDDESATSWSDKYNVVAATKAFKNYVLISDENSKLDVINTDTFNPKPGQEGIALRINFDEISKVVEAKKPGLFAQQWTNTLKDIGISETSVLTAQGSGVGHYNMRGRITDFDEDAVRTESLYDRMSGLLDRLNYIKENGGDVVEAEPIDEDGEIGSEDFSDIQPGEPGYDSTYLGYDKVAPADDFGGAPVPANPTARLGDIMPVRWSSAETDTTSPLVFEGDGPITEKSIYELKIIPALLYGGVTGERGFKSRVLESINFAPIKGKDGEIKAGISLLPGWEEAVDEENAVADEMLRLAFDQDAQSDPVPPEPVGPTADPGEYAPAPMDSPLEEPTDPLPTEDTDTAPE